MNAHYSRPYEADQPSGNGSGAGGYESCVVGADGRCTRWSHEHSDERYPKHPETCPWSVGEARCTCGLSDEPTPANQVARDLGFRPGLPPMNPPDPTGF